MDFTGRRLAYRSNVWRSATFAEGSPPPTTVPVGPLSATPFFSTDSIVSLGRLVPYLFTTSVPASHDSYVKGSFIASRTLTVAFSTSGPMPSPGIRVIVLAVDLGGASAAIIGADTTRTLQRSAAEDGNF